MLVTSQPFAFVERPDEIAEVITSIIDVSYEIPEGIELPEGFVPARPTNVVVCKWVGESDYLLISMEMSVYSGRIPWNLELVGPVDNDTYLYKRVSA